MAANLDIIECLRGDLTLQPVDAIVNAASRELRGGGGVDGAIHRAAGPGLLEELVARHPDGCPTGQARISGGHDLAARHVIHTVGPIWRGGEQGEPELLESCMHECLALAARHELRTLAFPAVSCGVYGYPRELAARVILRALAVDLPNYQFACLRIVLFQETMLSTFQGALSRERVGASGDA